jgi:hypothetical protein
VELNIDGRRKMLGMNKLMAALGAIALILAVIGTSLLVNGANAGDTRTGNDDTGLVSRNLGL